MPSRRVRTDQEDTPPTEQDVERLSSELREQARLARDRIRDRYAKLMEPRSFDTKDAD
jgi:hypothetical protein